MIQRVQSIYLLCATIFLAIFAFMPYMSLTTPDAVYSLTTTGLETLSSTTDVTVSSQNYTVLIITVLTALLSVITIFFYKNRKRQLLLCRINMLLYATLYVIMILTGYMTYSSLQPTAFNTTTYVVFPVCAIILNWLAMKAIQHDEKLVQDSDRMWTRNN